MTRSTESNTRFISLATVDITDRAVELIGAAPKEGRIGQGPIVSRFEEELAAWFGTRHAVVVANGTIADAAGLAAIATGSGVNFIGSDRFVFIAHQRETIERRLLPRIARPRSRG